MKADTKKLLITEQLKNWYVIDSILFNNHAKKCIKESAKYNEYVAIKAALLHNLYEFHTHIGYSPKHNKVFGSDKEIQRSAVFESKRSKSITASIMLKEEAKKELKDKIVQEAKTQNIKDVKGYTEKVLHEKFLKMSIDNCLVGIPLLESKTPQKGKDFKGQILEEAYKTLRDSLIHLSKSV